jgi:hypothetical protein
VYPYVLIASPYWHHHCYTPVHHRSRSKRHLQSIVPNHQYYPDLSEQQHPDYVPFDHARSNGKRHLKSVVPDTKLYPDHSDHTHCHSSSSKCHLKSIVPDTKLFPDHQAHIEHYDHAPFDHAHHNHHQHHRSSSKHHLQSPTHPVPQLLSNVMKTNIEEASDQALVANLQEIPMADADTPKPIRRKKSSVSYLSGRSDLVSNIFFFANKI